MKKIKYYLHYYLNQLVEVSDLKNETLKHYGTLIGIDQKGFKIKLKKGSTQIQKIYFEYSEVVVKPILRPLGKWSIRDSVRYNIPMNEMHEILCSKQYSVSVIQILLNEGFDFFGLIANGIAIEKPTNN